MTAFHISTYMQMGDDFDSRNRFLKNPADGVYDGHVVAGESWSVNVTSGSGHDKFMAIKFKMGSLTFSPVSTGSYVTAEPSGVSTGVRSE